MEGITNRQYLMLIAWINEQWNKPSRSDHYVMQVAEEVVNSRPRKRGSKPRPKLETYKIPFKSVVKQPVADPEQFKLLKNNLSKAKWIGSMTMPVTVVTIEKR